MFRVSVTVIEYALLFGLGFLSAILAGLLLAPAIHRRIVKFTEDRILATMPVSPQELRAQKDMVRAEMAVQVARANAARNGFPDAAALVLDWYHPPELTFDVLLASDVLYHRDSHDCLLQAIEQMLAPDGICWIGDPGRVNAREFFHSAGKTFEVHLYDRDGQEFWVPQVGEYQRFTLRRR